jgi:hypothetical protein
MHVKTSTRLNIVLSLLGPGQFEKDALAGG